MTFADWREPLRLLESQAGPATSAQRGLADNLGLRLADDVPRSVTSVLLEDHLRPTVWGDEPELATEKQRAFLARLGATDVAADADLSKAAASAWIDYRFTLQTIRHLKELRLVSGDQVVKWHAWRDPESGETMEFEDQHVVSSIGVDGLVYFKGGNGKCGWPSSLRRSKPEDSKPSQSSTTT
jgi:hypothetical protein